MAIGKIRCEWAGGGLMRDYHDEEWGTPLHDDRQLFEFLILEGMQAGLSWSTILNKRKAFRRAFDGFDPQVIAGYDEEKIAILLSDEQIVRNRLKIRGAVQNARAFLHIQAEFGTFDRYLWAYCDGKPIVNNFASLSQIPAETELSRQISKDLKRRGFTFVGPTIIYAYLQAVGVVNDHVTGCYRYDELNAK